MKKSELKTGMRLEHKSGIISIVYTNTGKDIFSLGNSGELFTLKHVDEDLSSLIENEDIIVAIYETSIYRRDINNHKGKGKLLWKKEELINWDNNPIVQSRFDDLTVKVISHSNVNFSGVVIVENEDYTLGCLDKTFFKNAFIFKK